MLKEIHNKSKDCNFFPTCGGCLHLDLQEQEYRKNKQKNLEKTLAKLGDFDIEYSWIKPNSRRKITLQIDEKNRIGFFAKASKTLVEIDKCYVAEDEISKIILPIKNFVKNFETNLITKIQVTLFDNIIDIIFFTKREFNFAQNQKMTQFAKDNKINVSCGLKNEIIPLFILQNNQIFLENNIKLNLNSQIFIQATKCGLQKIIEIISNFILQNFDKKKPKVIDIYSGFGVYSFAIAVLTKEVLAFEGSAEMTNLINKNSISNSLKNKIIAKNRDLFFYPISAKELQDFDLAIINPPRNGATPQIKEIANSAVKNLIYISCNPQTFAFDVKNLENSGFKIKKIIAIDQFFATDHFELAAIIQRI